MAGRTSSGNASMIHRCATFEAGGGFVAGFAGSRGRNVGAWFGFDVGKTTTVTGCTACCDTCVVHWGWYKVCGAAMAAFAIGRGWEMRFRFSYWGDTSEACTIMAS